MVLIKKILKKYGGNNEIPENFQVYIENINKYKNININSTFIQIFFLLIDYFVNKKQFLNNSNWDNFKCEKYDNYIEYRIYDKTYKIFTFGYKWTIIDETNSFWLGKLINTTVVNEYNVLIDGTATQKINNDFKNFLNYQIVKQRDLLYYFSTNNNNYYFIRELILLINKHINDNNFNIRYIENDKKNRASNFINILINIIITYNYKYN